MTEPAFIKTREHERFVEFCGACRRDRYIGLCYGLPGVGKTRSARQIAGWAGDPWAPGAAELDDDQLAFAATGRTVFYTPEVVNSPGRVQLDLTQVVARLRDVVREPSRRAFSHELAERKRLEAERLNRMKVEEDWLRDPDPDRTRQPEISPPRQRYSHWADPATLVIIDEADRLKANSLETVRDLFDRSGVAVVLIGMPGFEKRLARQPQLYSRIGFVHSYRPLAADELSVLLHDDPRALGLALPTGCAIAGDAASAIQRITSGNFRLVVRLLSQAGRILEVNGMDIITQAVVEAARESLVIGRA
jgi:hypothetical protein